jgi:hypothetical protein
MMLASTVQFSRYGRSRSPAPCGGEIPVLAEFTCRLAAVPSGPNSVLGPRNLLVDFPSRADEQLLAQPPSGRTHRTGQAARTE